MEPACPLLCEARSLVSLALLIPASCHPGAGIILQHGETWPRSGGAFPCASPTTSTHRGRVDANLIMRTLIAGRIRRGLPGAALHPLRGRLPMVDADRGWGVRDVCAVALVERTVLADRLPACLGNSQMRKLHFARAHGVPLHVRQSGADQASQHFDGEAAGHHRGQRIATWRRG
jgi:hypothetical protein